MRRRPSPIVAWLAAAAAILSCVGGDPPPPSVLLLVSDTLRADALGCYGGPAATPNLCGLAERGVLFESAYAGGSWTLPSSVALFTGRDAAAFSARGSAEQPATYHVPDVEELLAEQLLARGYRNYAFVENGVAAQPNVFQGFDLLRLYEGGESRVDAQRIHDRTGFRERDSRYAMLMPLLDRLVDPGEGPFFAIHWIMDPHAVYFPPREFVAGIRLDPAALPHPLRHYASLGSREVPERGESRLQEVADGLLPAEVEALRSLYHAEVESVDERVGYALRALASAGRSENTIVIFTSDHGEGFGEHGRFLHAPGWLYEEFVRVPLLIAGPGIAGGRRLGEVVSHVDLVPTLRELLGLPAHPSTEGRSLAGWLRGGAAPPERAAVVTGAPGKDGARALVRGRYKLIRSGGAVELFDLRADPAERRSLADGSPPEVVSTLSRQLAERDTAAAAASQGRLERLDPATLERTRAATEHQLRELGYLE